MITKKINKEARTVVGTLANAKDDFKVFIKKMQGKVNFQSLPKILRKAKS